ncbi:hypothetical protein BX661DRAFT_176167 [Kickxella alabastrina]|uniref:uncharacterized protein n=1 Tax=Kickxella alabastrina TaxID=61397 RepID=UPI00221E4616|nr:uncharacterized protein BX661DRAFT_176167 [Kickxella alabastrina]KAI7835148.1 hypothetical protein BX661DRAFT_176167 [Kickxella alabastrina]
MCNSANQWNSMHDLVVEFKKFSEAEVDKVSDDNCMLATSTFARNMVASIPNINKLNLDSYYSGCDAYTKRFCNIAFNSYAHQLKSYSSNVPVVLTATTFSPELIKLRITIDWTNISPLPKINASTITIISIKGCLGSLSWNNFASKGESTNIEFSNLKSIVVEHTDKRTLPDLAGHNNSNTNIAERAFQLHMPSLTFITLTDIDDDSKLLTASINFKHISRANITGSYKILKLFKHSHEGKMSYCDVEVSVSPDDDINEFYELTNIIFGSTIKLNRASLILNMDKSGWNTQPILWANLYDLEIKQSIQFDTLVELLSKMPRMNELTVNDILCNDLSYISIYRVKCISTSVTKLKLDFTSKGIPKGTMNAVVKYLILSMPSLKEMSWTGGHFDHVTFVEMYKSVYPHLASMRF